MERLHVNDPTQNEAIGTVMKQYHNARRTAARKNGGKERPLCFATMTGADCKIIKWKNCNGYDKCPFYMTQAEVRENQISAYKRIASLDNASQMNISEKYYDGRMPWKGVL